MPQRDAYRAEEIIGCNGVAGVAIRRVPVLDGVLGIRQFVLLAVGELVLLVLPAAFELSLSLHAVDTLVVKYASVVLEEGSVLA